MPGLALCHLTPETGVPRELRMRGVRAVAKDRLEPQAGDWAWSEKGKGKGKERVPGPHPLGQGLWYKVRSPRDERLCRISAPNSGSENSLMSSSVFSVIPFVFLFMCGGQTTILEVLC